MNINMISHVAIFTLLVGIGSNALPIHDGRIVNGTGTTIDDYPYQISLEHYGFHRCGGSIIGDRYVVTAAHCTDETTLSRLAIRAGSTFKEIDGQVIKVAKLFQHPDYKRLNKDNDISVLELEEDITHHIARKIQLADESFEVPVGELGVVTGWGRLNETTPGPPQLQVLDLPLLDLEVCKKVYGGVITPRMMCAGYLEGGKDTCQGDSGGPLAYENTLIGIVSWGRGCARPKYPGVYASIPKLRSYIKEVSGI